jgi:hypothetical protein
MTATISAPTTPKSTIPNDESLLAPVAETTEQERLAEQARADAEAKARQTCEDFAETLQRELVAAMGDMTPSSIAAAIADGTLHRAVEVDWTFFY